jgi:glycosyltransferase involved in cell wall biosynthesis
MKYNQFMPAVSVLLPCFNAEETLPAALGSLARQTLTDFQVILVNDGSTDGTQDLLEKWAAQDKRFQVLRQPHQGIVKSLNIGIEYCDAQYVARMDADDLSHSERLARQVAHLNQHPDCVLVASRVKGYPPHALREGFTIYLEWQNSLVDNADIHREIFIESPFAHPSVMMRRDALKSIGGYQDHGWPEDYDLWLRFYLAGKQFAKLPQTLLEWREHPARLTRQDSRYSLENFLRVKAHYLVRGPLKSRDAVLIWGAGMIGRRLSKHLLRQGAPLTAFIDVDPDKIGHTRRGFPILSPHDLLDWWHTSQNPVLLAAVGARGARKLIRQFLVQAGLHEGSDWWGVA